MFKRIGLLFILFIYITIYSWGDSRAFTWTGAFDGTTWDNSGNWSFAGGSGSTYPDEDASGTDTALINTGDTVAGNTAANLASLQIDGASNLVLSQGMTVTGDVTITTGLLFTNDSALTVNGNVTGGGELRASAGLPNETITVGGNFTVTTFTANDCLVVLNTATTSNVAGYTFYDLQINAAGAVTSTDAWTVSNSLTLTAGTWNAGNFVHQITGTWNSTGITFNEDTSTIQLLSTNPTITTSGAADPFNNLTLDDGGTLGSAVAVSGTLNLSSGTLDTLTWNLTAATLDHNNGGTITGTTGTLSFTDAALGDNITKTGGNISFTGGTVSLSAGISILDTGAGAGDITLGSTFDGNPGLTLTAGTGSITVTGIIGGGTVLGNIGFTSTTAINIGANISGAVLTFTGPVNLTADVTLTGTDVNFTSTLENGQNLIVNGSGTTTFGGLVGNGTPLTSITTNAAGSTAINTTVVSTTGAQTYNDNVALGADPVITGGSVTFNGTVDNGQNLTVNSAGVTTFAGLVGNGTQLTSITTDAAGSTAINTTVVSTTGAQTYNDNVALGADPVITGGSVTFNGTVDNGQNLTVNSAGVTTFTGLVGNGTQLTSIITDAAGSTAINTTVVSTTGAQTYNDNVSLGAAPVITGGSVTFNGTIDNGQNLTVNSAGVTTFAGLVGNGTPLTSIITDAAGSTAINTTVVSTTGAQTYNDNVSLGADPVITGGSVTFNGTIDNGQNLTVNSAGVTTFAGLVGNGTPLTSITTDAAGSTTISAASITTTGNQTYNDPVTLTVGTILTGAVPSFNGVTGGNNDLTLSFTGLTSIDNTFTGINDLTSNNTGTTDLTGAITTTGFQLYSDNVTLSGDTTLTGTDLTFSGTVDNGVNLVLNGSGVTTFTGLVGNGTQLTSITTDAAGSTAINTTVVSTTGAQTYNDNVSLGADPVITGGSVTFNGTVDNGQNLTVNSAGVTTFAGLVGNGTPLTSITTNAAGSTAINTTVVSTTGAQTYNDNVALGADPVITGGSVTFNGTVDNGQNLTVNSAGVTTFAGLVGNGTQLTSITTDAAGSTAINTTVVSTTGAQTYNDNVALGADPVITGGSVTFNGTVDNGQNLTVNSAGVTTFAGLVGNGTQLTSITTDAAGSTAINTTVVSTTGAQTYNDNVALGADPVITGGSVTFNGTVDNGQNLTVNSAGVTTFTGLVGNGTQLTSIITDAAGSTAINTTVVSTTGAQTYNDNVSLGAAPVITGGSVTFNGTIDNGQNLTVNSAGVTTFAGLVGNGTPLTSIITDAAGSTAINTTVVSTTGAQTYNDNVSLGADPVITGGSVTFNGTIDNGQNLTVNSAGVTTFAGLVGNGTPLTSITTDAAGSTTISAASITTTGNQTYNDPVTLTVGTILTGAVPSFNGVTGGNNDLTLSFTGLTSIDNTFTGINDLTSNNTGTTDLTGAITTTGFQLYSDNVTLSGDTTLTGTDLTFSGTVDNGVNLVLNGSGVTTFTGLVGNGTQLTSITTDAAGSTAINTTVVSTTGAQTYNDNVSLGADPVITGGSVTFNGTVDNGQNLTVNSAGVTTFAGLVGNGTQLTSLTTDAAGSTAINTTAVSTTGDQTYNDGVTLGADTNLTTGGTATFNGTVAGAAHALTVTGAAVFGDAPADAITGVTDLQVTGTTTINTSGITTTLTQVYGLAVTLGTDVTLTGTTGTFTTGVTGAGNDLTLNFTGLTVINGTFTGIGNLTSGNTGTTQLSGTITTVGYQLYNDAVQLTGNTTLNTTNSNVTFVSTVDCDAAGRTLTISAGTGTTSFGNTAGVTNNLGAVSITSDEIDFSGGAGSFHGNSTLLLQPSGGAVPIGIGGGAGTLDLSAADISALADGFTSITIGYAAGTALITSNGAGFTDPVLIQSGGVGGVVTLTTAAVAGTGNATVEIAAETINLNYAGTSVSTAGQNITFTGAVSLGAASAVTTGAAGGDISFSSTINGGSNLTLTAGTGNVLVTGAAGGGTPVGVFSIASATQADVNNISGTGISITAGNIDLNGTAYTASAGDVAFTGGIDLEGGAATTVSASAAATFGGLLNGGVDLTVNAGGVTTFGDIVGGLTPLTSITTNAAGSTTVNTTAGAITVTAGTQVYNDGVTLGQDVNFTGSVTFNGTVAGGTYDLTVTGAAVFGDAPADTVTGVTDLQVTGTTTINTSGITTTGTQTYNLMLTLGTDVTLTGTTGTFTTGVTGAGNDLTLNFTGLTVINGSFAGIGNLTSGNTGTTQLSGTITTVGYQLYNDAVQLTGNTALNTTDSNVTFVSTVDCDAAGRTLTISAGTGTTSFGNTAGVTNNLGAVSITSDEIDFSGGAGSFHGNSTLLLQPSGGAVPIGIGGGAGTLDLSAADISALADGFTSITIGYAAGTALITSNGAGFTDPVLIQSGGVGGVVTLTTAAVAGTGNATVEIAAETINLNYAGTSVSTAGQNITFTGAVSLGAASAVTTGAAGGDISFSSTINGGSNLTLTAGTGNVLVTGAAGGGTPVGVFSIASATQADVNNISGTGISITAGNIDLNGTAYTASAGDVAFTGGIDLEGGAATTVSASAAATFGGLLNGGVDLTVNAGGVTTFGDIVGGLTPLTSITTNAAGSTTVNTTAGAITVTAGTQVYNDGVTLGQDVNFTGSVTFNGTVAGGTYDLTVTGAAVFGDAPADTVTGVTDLQVTGTTTINTSGITTTGTQTYNLMLTLGTDVTLTGTTGTFTTGVTGAGNDLTLNFTGLTVINGNFAGIGNLTSGNTGTTQLSGTITTVGYQLYNDAVQLTGNTTLNTTDSNVTFASTVNGLAAYTQDLGINVGAGNINFGDGAGDTVGAGTPVGDITITSAADVRCYDSVAADSITQSAGTGTSRFDSTVALRSNGGTAGAVVDLDLTGAAFIFNGTVSTLNGGSVEVTNTGNLTVAAGGSFNIDGTFNQNGAGGVSIAGNITTTNDNINISSAFTVAADITFSTGAAGIGDITCSSAVDGDGTPNSLTLTSGQGDTILSGAVGSTNALSALSITGNDITLTGIGGAASGVTGNVTAAGTDAGDNSRVTLNGTTYWSTGSQTYSSGTDQCVVALSGNSNFNAGGAGFTFDDVYFDHSGWTVNLLVNLTCHQFVFYRGTINLNGNTIATTASGGGDFAVFGAGYDPVDSDMAATDPNNTFFAYPGAVTFTYYPAGGTYAGGPPVNFSTAPTAVLTIPAGSTITAGGNFYNNGTNMNGAGAWTLNIQDNSSSDPVTNGSWGSPYAVAFNMGVENCTAVGGWVSATTAQGGAPAETNNNVTDTTPASCTNWDFTRPQITSVETVYDNVVRITFSENLENSNGEIAARAGSVFLDDNTVAFTGTFTDAECTTATGTTEPINVFYLQTTNTTWNTDATGTSAGVIDLSTDRSGVQRNVTAVVNVFPDIAMLKGAFYSAEGKTFVRNYSNNGYAEFNGTTDECRPVLASVTADRDGGTADAYNYHNYFQLIYSEPVNLGTHADFAIAAGAPASNYRAQSSFAAGEYGGSIEQNGADVDITGLFSYLTATVTKGSTDATPEINSLYRANTGGNANSAGDNGLRIFIAGYSTGADPDQTYPGYIRSITDPVGEVITVPANANITDSAGNVLEHTAGSTYAKAAVTVAGAGWDVDPPVIASYRPGGVAGIYHEILTRDTDTNNLIDRLELHIHDNSTDDGTWNSTADHPDASGASYGIRDTSIIDAGTGFSINSTGNATVRPASGFTMSTDVDNALYFPAGPPYQINTQNDMYFSISFNDIELPLNYLTQIILSYDSNTGLITDLAGNLLPDETDINCYEQVPPDITYTLSVVGDNKIYVKFSEYVYGDNTKTSAVNAADFSVAGLTVSSVTPVEINTLDSLGVLTAFINLSADLTADDAVSRVLTPFDGVSVYDALGTPMDAAETHRITDVGMGVVEPVWADDGIESESIQSGGTLKVFDGSGRIHDNDITLQASIRAPSAVSSPASIFFDGDVSSSYYWNNIWLPVLIQGFNPDGNSDARGAAAYSSSGALRNFIIPENDKDMEAGTDLDFLIRVGDLYCARAADSSDPRTVAPWSMKVRGVKKQRAGVTILNNVINPLEGEKTILTYDLEKSGTVTINIFSLSGDVVKTLFKGRQPSGSYRFTWDGKNTGGRAVARGIYFIRVVGPDIDEYRKVMVVK